MFTPLFDYFIFSTFLIFVVYCIPVTFCVFGFVFKMQEFNQLLDMCLSRRENAERRNPQFYLAFRNDVRDADDICVDFIGSK